VSSAQTAEEALNKIEINKVPFFILINHSAIS